MPNNLGDVLTRFWNASFSQLPWWVFCFWTIAFHFMFLFLFCFFFNAASFLIPSKIKFLLLLRQSEVGLWHRAVYSLLAFVWRLLIDLHAPLYAIGNTPLHEPLALIFVLSLLRFFLLITGIVSKKVWPILKRHPYPERLLRLLKCHNLVNNDKAFRLLFTTQKKNVTKAWFSLSDKTPLLFITHDCEELSSFQLTGNITGSLTAQSRNSLQDLFLPWQIWCGRSLSPKKAGRDF